MTDQPPTTQLQDAAEAGPAASNSGAPAGAVADAPGADRPEVAIGAAFAGGLALALILKRLAR